MEAAANMEDLIIHQDPDYAEVGPRCDTHLTTEDGTVFNVDSKLLSRHSKFFKNLFLEVEEAGQSTVIRHIKPDIFKIILTYLNTGEVLLTAENIIDLLVASDFLMIESLLDKCRKFALQNKKVENIVSFFLTANRIKGLGMEHQCRRYLVMCFEKAVMNSMDEACCLPYEELKYFLSHRSLNVSDEHTIWSVIEAWVQKEPVIRQPLVPELLRCLSIHEIGDELASNILSSPIIRNNICYRDVEDPYVTFDFLSDIMKAQSVILFRNQLPIITEVRLPRFLHVVAKLFQDRDGAELYLSYDDSLDFWRKVGEISLKGARIFVSGHLVYYLKRVLDGHYEFSGFYYDLLKNEEKRMALPNFPDYVVGEVGGCVYALEIYGTTIKRYVHESDLWKNVRRVRYRGCISGALNVNGLLHVLGEVDGSNRMFMRVYDPSKDKWGRVTSPTVRRFFVESAVYQGRIFLVGGQIDVGDEESDQDNDEECDEDYDEECDEDYDEECDEDYYDECDEDYECIGYEYEFDEDDGEEIDEDDDEEINEDDDFGDHLAFLALDQLCLPMLFNAMEENNNGLDDDDDDEERDPDEDDDDFADDHPDVLLNNMEENDDDDDNEDDESDEVVDNPDDVDNNDFEDAPPDLLQNAIDNNREEAMNNIEQDESISKAVEVYDPKSNEWVIYPELPFRFSPVFASVVKDRLYVYQNPQRPVTYWDGSGQWNIVEDPSRLFQHKFSAVKNEDVVRQIMKRNKEEDPTVWLETGLEKVIP